MNPSLSADAVAFGDTARKAIEAAGGDSFAMEAERTGDRSGASSVLDGLGAWELDPYASDDERDAAAALCRSAGWWALPDPVAERLARPHDLDVDALTVAGPTAAIGGTSLRWAAIDLDGRRFTVSAGDASGPVRKAGWVVPVTTTAVDGAGDPALALVLPCWTLLGMLDRAVALTAEYVQQRQQFGQPLSSFQGVQFQLTEAEVERVGLDELAKYALWTLDVDDALALRLAAVEAAEVTFRVTHQLHGAIGFCDETTLSWLSRASQPLRRLPFGLSATRDLLASRLGRHALPGLFA